MSAQSARLYHYTEAKNTLDSIGRILIRINQAYTPSWLLSELEYSYRKLDCIVGERKRVMAEFGEEI